GSFTAQASGAVGGNSLSRLLVRAAYIGTATVTIPGLGDFTHAIDGQWSGVINLDRGTATGKLKPDAGGGLTGNSTTPPELTTNVPSPTAIGGSKPHRSEPDFRG